MVLGSGRRQDQGGAEQRDEAAHGPSVASPSALVGPQPELTQASDCRFDCSPIRASRPPSFTSRFAFGMCHVLEIRTEANH